MGKDGGPTRQPQRKVGFALLAPRGGFKTKPAVIQWKKIVRSVLLDARPHRWPPKQLIIALLAPRANSWMRLLHLLHGVKVVQKALLNPTKHRLIVLFVPLQSIPLEKVLHCV